MVSVGVSLGLLAGLCLAGWREMTTGALRSEKDVGAYSQLPILGSIRCLRTRRAAPAKALGLAGMVGRQLGRAAIMSVGARYYIGRL